MTPFYDFIPTVGIAAAATQDVVTSTVIGAVTILEVAVLCGLALMAHVRQGR